MIQEKERLTREKQQKQLLEEERLLAKAKQEQERQELVEAELKSTTNSF